METETTTSTSSPYITPLLKIFPNFSEAKDFLKDGGVIFFEDDEKNLEVVDLAQGHRNLIIGEPGIGKTELLKKIQEYFHEQASLTAFVSLRQNDVEQVIDAFLKRKDDRTKILFLDALDEVQSSLFPSILEKIVEISEKYPKVIIYLSARLVFISKYATSFPGYRFITISPFTERQVRDYLIASGRSQEDVGVLLDRVTSFNHRIRVIQVPRYLSFLNKFLEEKGVEAASEISRNELFEYFIYSKLESEKKLGAEKRLITKRVLEKLALTMEIYQTNVISEDELMSFFDELKSDLKNAALSQMDLSIFYEHSLLKISQENLEKIEFENTEFQEYLAAKEITRFPDPSRAAFSFAVDSTTKEIYPTWFNALTFFVDMHPELLGQLMEFSGIRASEKFKVVDGGFITFLSRIDPRSIPRELRQELFLDVFDYHQRTLQWIPWELFPLLSSFYYPTIEEVLKLWVGKAESENGAKHFVPIGNVAYVVKYLFQSGKPIDKAYWREKLLIFAADKNDNGAMQRQALSALVELADPTVIDELPNLMSSDQLVMRAFLSLCRELAPNHPKSVDYFIEAVKRDDFYGRYGFLEITTPESLKKFLQTFNSDEVFQREFIKDMSLFQKEDGQIAKHIDAVFDEELGEMSKEALVKCTNIHIAHSAEKSTFVIELWKVLQKKYPDFLTEMVDRIRKVPEGKMGLYFALDFFAEVIDKGEVESLIDAMIGVGEKDNALSLMFKVKFSGRKDAEDIFETGRKKFPDEYKQWEDARAKADTDSVREQKSNDRDLLQEFRTLLEPEPGKYGNGVFEFYVDNVKRLELLLTDSDRQRLKDLLTGTIFKFINPAEFKLTITSQHNGAKTYTTSQGVHLFGDALEAAKILGIDLSPYRQQILNYIPFAFDSHLKIIFDLFQNIKTEEMHSVLEVYRKRESDLWRHQIPSFIEACKKYNIVESAPILKEFVKESQCERYERERALIVGDMLVPDPLFAKEIFELYKDSKDDVERLLSYTANGLLITQHADEEAIHWRLQQVLDRAAPFISEEGVHSVGDLEDEITHSHSFAKPLMELKKAEYIQNYLDLLDEAMEVWARGKEFHAYGEYLWGIVYAYFEGLKEGRLFEPLRLLEERISELKDQAGANWLAGRMVQLRRTYLSYLGKPRNISEAVKKYNENREFDNKKIQNSQDLFRHIQDALETDLTRWIEDEGAYELIVNRETKKGQKKQYERLVQRTIKTQIENAFLRRGFQVELTRESQLLDDKKTDFLVRYGFVGPVIIEVKLTSNKDIQGKKIDKSDSYESMKQYMAGYGASHGVFMVIDNWGAKNLQDVKRIFESIPNVWMKSFECHSIAQKKAKKKVAKHQPRKISRKKKASKKSVNKSKKK